HYLYFFFPAYPDPRHLHSSLHDALPILPMDLLTRREFMARAEAVRQVHYPASAAQLDRAKERLAFEEMFVLQVAAQLAKRARQRSEEHTSELQSRGHLVCRLLLEKKKQI